MIPYYQFLTIHIGPLAIQVWGLLVALGILTALLFSHRLAKKQGLDEKTLLDFAFWILIASFFGARVLYAVYNPAYIFADFWNFFRVWQGGLSIMGGFLGAFAAGFIFARRRKMDFLPYADVVLRGLPLGLFVGRLGCGAIHDHIGKITTMPWGLQWVDGTVRHENGWYDSLNGLIMFVVLWFLYHRAPRFQGFALVFFLLWYGVVRFFLDFLRATDLPGVSDVRFWGLTPAQYLSFVMVGAGVYAFLHLRPSKVVS